MLGEHGLQQLVNAQEDIVVLVERKIVYRMMMDQIVMIKLIQVNQVMMIRKMTANLCVTVAVVAGNDDIASAGAELVAASSPFIVKAGLTTRPHRQDARTLLPYF